MLFNLSSTSGSYPFVDIAIYTLNIEIHRYIDGPMARLSSKVSALIGQGQGEVQTSEESTFVKSYISENTGQPGLKITDVNNT